MTVSPLPVVQYLIAFNNGPLDDPALITTVAAPGVLGAVNVWTDITAYVLGHNFSRGRQHELTMFEAGTCHISLGNNDARFNPWNSSGPYYGLLVPRKLLQIRATWASTTYTRFTGHVDAWPTLWTTPVGAYAQVNATDAFRLFNLMNIVPMYAGIVLDDGAGDYWRFTDPAGSSIAQNFAVGEVAENLTSGTLAGTAAQFGQAGGLTPDPSTSCGTLGQTLFNAPSLTTSLAASWSIEIWVKYLNGTMGSGALGGQGVGIYLKDAGGVQVQLGIGDNYTAGYGAICTVIASGIQANSGPGPGQGMATDSKWHHYVWTFDGTTLKSYIDGALDVSSTSTGTGCQVAVDSFTNGGAILMTAPAAADLFVQELALYPSALTATQIANHYNIGALPQQATDARITTVLNGLKWSQGARVLDAGASIVQACPSSMQSVKVLTHMQDVECTEAGGLFLDAVGRVKFVSRTSLFTNALYRSSQATFGDNFGAGQIPFQPGPNLALDDLDMYNTASGQRQGGAIVQQIDQVSVAAYGPQAWASPANLIGISDEEVLNRLAYIVSQYAQPVERMRTFTVSLIDLIAPNLIASVLVLDLLYQITVQRAGVPGGGSGFVEVGLIEQIQESVTADSWDLTFSMDVADVKQYFEWGTSQWGNSTAWAY